MQILAWALIGVGLAAMIWGLPAAHRLSRPYDILASLAFLAGMAAALLGALLASVPRFFQG